MVLTWDDDNPIRLWDIQSKRQVASFEVKDNGGIFANNDNLAVHDKKGIFLVWNNRKLKVFNDTGREVAYTMEYKDIVSGADFNRKGDAILSWSKKGEIDSFKLINTDGTKAIHNKRIATIRHEDEVNGAVFNFDESRILSWSDDKTARLWDSTTGKQLIPVMEHGDNVISAAFNIDESRILTQSNNWDGKARLWDISIDTDWPANKVLLKVEVETGTEMTSVGEVHALSIAAWQKRKWCEYDKIQYQLRRISQEEWQTSDRLCKQLKSSQTK